MALSGSKKVSVLLREITSKYDCDFYCLNCFHSFRTKNNLKSYKRVSENKDFCNIVMPSEDAKILELNQIKNLIKYHSLFMQIVNV